MKFRTDRQRKAVMAKINRLRQKEPYKDYDRDGVVNKHDCQPLNPKQQGLKHRHIRKIKKSKEYKSLSKAKKKRLDTALKQLEKTSTSEEVALWIRKHEKLLEGLVVGSALTTSLLVGAMPAIILSAGEVTLQKKLRKFESKKAEKEFRRWDTTSKKLQRKGFTKKQAGMIIKGRITRFERVAEAKDRKAEKQRMEAKA